MEEIWKDIVGYEGIYKVSNLGRFLSCRRLIFKNGGEFYCKEIIMKIHTDKLGYSRIILRKDNKSVNQLCHRLVALTFIPNIDNKPAVNHIDGLKTNNYITNLEWCTNSENRFHAFRIGLTSATGIKNNSVKLTESQVLEIRKIHRDNPETLLITTAKKFGVSKQLISKINLRINWTHI